MSTSIINDIVPILRRGIGDNEIPYTYQDSALAEYIIDAMGKISLDYEHGYEVETDGDTITNDVTKAEQVLFAMQSKLDILTNQPEISFNTPDFSIRRKANDKKALRKQIEKAINNLKIAKGLGKNNTEFDSFVDRFEDWLYVKRL